jgi:hypothetical protein
VPPEIAVLNAVGIPVHIVVAPDIGPPLPEIVIVAVLIAEQE